MHIITPVKKKDKEDMNGRVRQEVAGLKRWKRWIKVKGSVTGERMEEGVIKDFLSV